MKDQRAEEFFKRHINLNGKGRVTEEDEDPQTIDKVEDWEQSNGE
jgi:hypothetical protein